MLLGILGHVADDDQAQSIVHRLTGAVPYQLRSPEQISGFFHGLELLEPGVVPVSQWRPDPSPFGPPRHVDTYGGMARKS